jgi:predicted dienelactone hydrolase
MTASAGCRAFELLDEKMSMTFPMLVMYPSNSPEQPETLGPYTLNVAMNGPAASGSFPLIVISHGSGGSHLVYRTLAEHLARNGFVVAMPEHPRNNRNNNDLEGTAANLANRPRHVHLVIDWAFSSEAFGSCLIPDTVAIIGNSMGGYTALATAGGVPTAFPHEAAYAQGADDQRPRQIEVIPDSRVKALVLLAPAAAWFMAPGALRGVQVPILLWTAEKDSYTPEFHAQIIKAGVPDQTRIEHRIAANAGHFSFLSPFPEAMTNPAFLPSQDPEGFDRECFHQEMNAGILAFLNPVTLT